MVNSIELRIKECLSGGGEVNKEAKRGMYRVGRERESRKSTSVWITSERL